MDDLRRDITEAFDEDQAALGDLSGVRERIVRSALAERGARGKSRMQLAAGLAAVLIAAIVIGLVLAYTPRSHH